MLESIQLFAKLKDFYSGIQKMIVDVQEQISSYSLNEISLSSTSWTRKWV